MDYLAKPDVLTTPDDYLLVCDCIFEKNLPDEVKVPPKKIQVGSKRDSGSRTSIEVKELNLKIQKTKENPESPEKPFNKNSEVIEL